MQQLGFAEILAVCGLSYVLSNSTIINNSKVEEIEGTIVARYVYDGKVGRYRDLQTGRFVSQANLPYPSNLGFDSFNIGTLNPGMVIDRYGKLTGRYAGQPGATIGERGMPPGSESLTYTKFEIIKPIENVKIGPATAVKDFGASGGAIQYQLPYNFQYLIDNGFIKVIK